MQCPLCQQSKIIFTGLTKNNYRLFHCTKCDLRFIDPIPTEVELNNYYNKYLEEKGYKYLNKEFSDYKIKTIWQERINLLKQFNYKKDTSILEVGAGTGEWLRALKSNNYNDFTALEISEEEYNILNKQFPGKIIKTPLNNYTSDKQFDVVCLWDVLEHLNELNKNFFSLKNLLSRNGIIIIATPNINSISLKIKKNNWRYLTPPEHILYFNKKSVINLAKKFNFELIYFTTNLQIQAFLYNSDKDKNKKEIKINLNMYKYKLFIEKLIKPFLFNRGEIITFILRKSL